MCTSAAQTSAGTGPKAVVNHTAVHVPKDKCTFADTCHTKCMVIAFLRIRFWTCMVAALTLDPIFSLSQSGNIEGGPMPVLTPDFAVSSRPHGQQTDHPCQ